MVVKEYRNPRKKYGILKLLFCGNHDELIQSSKNLYTEKVFSESRRSFLVQPMCTA